jgi:hypothetical protein
LWLVGANPTELKQCPTVISRIENVRAFRANSVAAGTRKFAETPTLFCQIAQPKTEYIAVPKVSSKCRRYIPLVKWRIIIYVAHHKMAVYQYL